MSATPALSNGMIGRVQKRISDGLYLDWKDSEFIHRELEIFAMDLMKEWEASNKLGPIAYITLDDPGDEQKEVSL